MTLADSAAIYLSIGEGEWVEKEVASDYEDDRRDEENRMDPNHSQSLVLKMIKNKPYFGILEEYSNFPPPALGTLKKGPAWSMVKNMRLGLRGSRDCVNR